MAEQPMTLVDIINIREQAKLLAAELAYYARGPVRLHLIGGGKLGFTYDTAGEGKIIDIYINPSVLIEIRNRARAVRVWRGLGFHELAHHLWPAEEQYDRAVAEGFKELFNLIDDEQNERRGRSKDPTWGACFQTLAAWVIRKDKCFTRQEATGDQTGETSYIARYNKFLYHFRRHLPGAKDPVVAEALAMIPDRLKDLSKDELLDLTRQVHKVLARGVAVPVPAQSSDGDETATEDKPGPVPESKDKPGENPNKIPLWRRMTGSKWFYPILAVFVLSWLYLFTRHGLSGWDMAFWGTAIAAIFLGLAFVLDMLLVWLAEKSAEKANKSKVKPGRLAAIGSAAQNTWQTVCSSARIAADSIASCLKTIGSAADKWTPKPIVFTSAWRYCRLLAVAGRAAKATWQSIAHTAAGIWHTLARLCRLTRRIVLKVWHSSVFRAFLLSAPLAALLAMVAAAIMKTNWVALIIIVTILLLLGFLCWLLRKKIKNFVMRIPVLPLPHPADIANIGHLDDSMLEFAVIHNFVPVEANQAALDHLLPDVLPLACQMRRYLEQTGLACVDLDDQESGHELVDDIEKAALGATEIWVDEQKAAKASVHIEVGIDCSGSMLYKPKPISDCQDSTIIEYKIDLAKRFGLLIDEAVRGVPGITAHFWGFTNQAIFDCGTAGQQRVSGLQANGGNNDSAMLWHMYKSAARSHGELRILLMVSDGIPAECTWSSLHNLVCRLEMAGFVPVQIAVDKIDKPAFKTYFVDLAGQSMDSAVIEFGRMLLCLVDQLR